MRNLKELIQDVLRELASPQDVVYAEIRAQSKVIIKHLLKLYVLRNPVETDHWIAEIHGAISDFYMSKLKGRGYPSKKVYYTLLCDEPLGEKDGRDFATDIHGVLGVDIGAGEAHQIMLRLMDFYNYLCVLLANRQYTLAKIRVWIKKDLGQ